MRLLVTRAEPDASSLAAALAARGHSALIDPLMTIEPLAIESGADPIGPLNAAQALLFTSANGVRAFAARCERRDLPAFAVGERTASALREIGCADVTSAGGDVESLAALVAERLDPAAGALVHVSGVDRAGDLAGALRRRGFAVDQRALYQARAATGLAPETQCALREGTLDGVLLFSPRSAALFADLVETADLAAAARRLTAWCLSEAVAARVAALRPRATVVAAAPTQRAMFASLDQQHRAPAEPAGVHER